MDREVFQKQFGLLGDSDAIKHVTTKIMQVSRTDITVLLMGESGVGKDVIARAIHSLSNRKHKDIVLVNCGAIPEGIIESELFGHEKGAFTGANEAREGYFEKANGGTIFLDEIADTPKNVQVKLLRVLETGEYFRVGSSQLRKTDARIVAATNKDLWKEVEKGNFREDLYYRLDTVTIKVPPLRERSEDVIPIFKKFVNEYSAKYDSVFQGFSDDARELLVSYRWPGNVRELRNVAEQLVVLEKSQFIDAEKLSKYLKGRQRQGSTDHLPVHISNQHTQSSSSSAHSTSPSPDQGLVYKALVDLRGEITEMKKMLTALMYGNMGSVPSFPKALPPHQSSAEYEPEIFSPITNFNREHRKDIPLGISSAPHYPEIEIEKSEQDEFFDFFDNDSIPSFEETEKFLIKKSLEKYDGNRRKASEALGVSERTLYRKLDQYGLG